ncbi:hypothetical protein [Planctomicrobium sp. SH527]|uniref:hypothetical protein n=1 Tax=Planctomicrobium sp. SH527 TaxID=3448123 RepID=UPI003F5B6531
MLPANQSYPISAYLNRFGRLFLRPFDAKRPCLFAVLVCCLSLHLVAEALSADQLLAGAAKVDVTDYDHGPVNDPLYVKAIVFKSGDQTAVIMSVDAVAIGEIGRINNEYLPTVRKRLQTELGIAPEHVLVNASHCHGVVRADIADQTVEAVRKAMGSLVAVRVGTGVGEESRIMENRRLKLKSGKEVDVRHAYPLPPDDEVAEVGLTDPEIGVLRIDREDGQTLGVIYNFACHPIQGVPSGANTADIIGYSSKVIEENLSEGTVALFLQGCGGDINPVFYKDVDHPRSAEPLGNMLGLSTLRAVRKIECKKEAPFKVLNETLTLPRGDRTDRIAQLEAEQRRTLQKLQGTSLNLKTFMPLMVKHNLAEEFPAYYSHRYLYDEKQGRDDLKKLDAENRRNLEAYLKNIHTMEELTRLQTNLALLKKHQASLVASGKRTIDVEVMGIRIGDFVLTTFPGELTVTIGLNIKKKSSHEMTFLAGYTNGYIYYAPTADQLLNLGGAQEDSDCILAPEWQELFEAKAASLIKALLET